ncbi:hypothetical protein TTHERM_00577380 (macronuclear) [Tetrahymena thermophila SB210]|uniref:Uncharacterized protein n=1 Tax=Tetrahymena thermophila (strain SB210) TaxID=312017 RepID=Q22UW5_TETTS|nr:hypothetical protein TTHERM_00577380 [Tetrahymena thermophila SB210]EAR89183.1 hypothetical protein TTHERM_00577380 [Tetrahymena thermophila SB210]|eukprot:XP_001009428.1 hypothetical protein TTHERM_00577380 [Tetrahymena thermophila SB210]
MFEEKIKTLVVEILPNTKRTKDLRDKKEKEERKKREEAEKAMAEKHQQELQIRKLVEEKKKQKQQEELKKKEEERKKAEERQQISTLKGKFGSMINDLKQNSTTLDYTVSGLDLRPAQIRILVKAVEKNFSLKGLNMSRKKIGDAEGVEIAHNLKKNFVLERLELEGNYLGPRTAHSIAELLVENNCIRVIDLEGNDLTNSGKDNSGIEAICQSLKNNDTLLCLNLTNTNLDENCSDFLVQMLEKNDTIINLDIDQNPKMNLEDVRKIQEKLKINKQNYDDERYKEFDERKRMCNEENISEIIHIREESKRIAQENINIRIEAQRQDKEEKWRNFLEQNEVKLKKLYDKITKEVFLGGKKKKKKKKGKKKK